MPVSRTHAPRTHEARTDARRKPGTIRSIAEVSGTGGLRFRAFAAISPAERDGCRGTANAVGLYGPPGFKSPILRCDQQFRPSVWSRRTAAFRFRGLCVATAAIWPPIYLIATRRRAGPAMPGIRAGLAPITNGPAVICPLRRQTSRYARAMFRPASGRYRRRTAAPRGRGVSPCVLCGLRTGWRAQAVEYGLQDGFGIAGVAVDRRDGDDHVEDLFEGEVVADFVRVLRGGEERPASGDHPGAAVFEQRTAAAATPPPRRRAGGA